MTSWLGNSASSFWIISFMPDNALLVSSTVCSVTLTPATCGLMCFELVGVIVQLFIHFTFAKSVDICLEMGVGKGLTDSERKEIYIIYLGLYHYLHIKSPLLVHKLVWLILKGLVLSSLKLTFWFQSLNLVLLNWFGVRPVSWIRIGCGISQWFDDYMTLSGCCVHVIRMEYTAAFKGTNAKVERTSDVC